MDVDVVAGSVILHLALLVDLVLWTLISSLEARARRVETALALAGAADVLLRQGARVLGGPHVIM